MTAELESQNSWLSNSDMEQVRNRLPIVYVNVIPVRTDATGEVTEIGLLLSPDDDGNFRHALISGRVLYNERVRDALVRHIEKDLGPVSFPRIPLSINPFGVFEYFPTPDVSGLFDTRQHAIALAFVVSVSGDCRPSQQALSLNWIRREELSSGFLEREMSNGQHQVVISGLASVGLVL